MKMKMMKKLILTAQDKVKKFITLTLYPNTLTDDEMGALWIMAKYPGDTIYRDDPDAEWPQPLVWTADGGICSSIVWHVIYTLETRGLIKARKWIHHNDIHPPSTRGRTWHIQWNKMKAFPQTKELSVQAAIGSL